MAVFICNKNFKRQELTSKKQASKIFVLAVTFAVSVVCGVSALAYIPVSFKEMIAATTPLFTAIIAFAAGEREDWMRSLALLMVAVGAVIATEGEPMWNTLGFLLGMAATLTRGLKSVLQHVLLSSEEKLDSMNLLRFMSMFAVAVLIPTAAIVDGPLLFINTVTSHIQSGNTEFLMWLTLNVCSAFLVNLFQFLVTKLVGPTALQVLGNFKGVLCAVLSVVIFENPVTVQSVGGYTLTTAGVFCYSYLKQQQSGIRFAKLKAGSKMSPVAKTRLPIDAAQLPLLNPESKV
eukprot:CAMPEP_0117670174 /NCGR_PEP_ID=MMETSP0804-20121206/12588_1 /TAXON_ID=1074897 /ORGANISM="Tetraselmis astigmatica, Strain CCMP880" /LENGTH=290 /DNA_ID=CAMNT_0005478407 /DNA_START=181 /DNA_END=1053 /DNA_ORIENTATION=-